MRPTLSCQLIQLSTVDGYHLPGLWHAAGKRAVVFLHGNGSTSVFYKVEKMQAFATTLAAAGWGFLAFNNRGAHYVKKLQRHTDTTEEVYDRLGTAYERIADCVPDINAAVDFLREQGVTNIVLVGESSGANKICVYNHLFPHHDMRGCALVAGGDDTGWYYSQLGDERFWALLAEGKERVAAGAGEDLIVSLLPQLLSYQSFVDTCDPDGDYNCFPFLEAAGTFALSTQPLFRFFHEITMPTLALYGELDEFSGVPPAQALDLLRKHSGAPHALTTQLISGADHSFHAHIAVEVDSIARWLTTLA